MKHWSTIRRSLTAAMVAAGAVAFALPAHAQFAPPPPTGVPIGGADPLFGGFRPGFTFNPQLPPNGNGFSSSFNNPFANPFTNPLMNGLGTQFDTTGFVNGSNIFSNPNGFIDPRLTGIFGPEAVVSPFTPVAGPFGGVVGSYLPGSADVGLPPPAAYTTARLPLLGINTPARTVGGLPPNLFANRRIGGSSTARTRTTQAQPSAATRRDMDADLEVRAATRMAAIMKSRPMVPGHVTRADATEVQVKIDRRNVTRHYGLSEVFFYRNDQLLDAALAPGRLHKGDAVLVPDSSGQAL